MNEHTYPEGLKVFTWEHEEWVIASDPEDADKVYAEHAGDTIQNQTGDDSAVWTEEAPDKVFKMDDDGDRSEDTCAGWVRKIGKRGYFASANY